MLKALRSKWAATSLDRFTIGDLLVLVRDVSVKTIHESISELRSSGDVIEVGERKSARRGRPEHEFSWAEGRREICRAQLEGQLVDFGPPSASVRVGAEAGLGDLSDDDPIGAGVDLLVTLVETAELAREPEKRLEISSKARAELDILRVMASYDERLPAIESLAERLERVKLADSADRTKVLLTDELASLWRNLDGNVASAGNFYPKAMNLTDVLEQGLVFAFDTTHDSRVSLDLRSMAEGVGHQCVIFQLGTEDQSTMELSLKQLAQFFATPASVNAQVWMIVDESDASNRVLTGIGDAFGNADSVREALRGAREAGETSSSTADDPTELILGGAATLDGLGGTGWIAKGYAKQSILTNALGRPDADRIDQGALINVTLNNPAVLSYARFSSPNFLHTMDCYDLGSSSPEKVQGRIIASFRPSTTNTTKFGPRRAAAG
jgi:hypothetical protein